MTTDHAWMARALQLARKGLYSTHPNPRVGCVIVADGELVGEGWHVRAGEPHAEVHALRQAGVPAKLSRDAGRYVCNALAYRAYQWAAAGPKPRLAVFVHIPRPSPHLPASALTRAIEALLVALAAQFRAASAR